MTHSDKVKALAALEHYESIGKFIFAAVTESGATIQTGGGESMRSAISVANVKLYIHVMH